MHHHHHSPPISSLRLERALTAAADLCVLVIYVRSAMDQGAGRLESDKVVNADVNLDFPLE